MLNMGSSAGSCRTAGGRAAVRLLLFGVIWFALSLGIGLWSLGHARPGAPRQLRESGGPRLQALRQQAFLAVLERAAAGVPHARLSQEPRSGSDDVLQCVMEGVSAPLRLALGMQERVEVWRRSMHPGAESPLLRPGEAPRLVWRDDGSLEACINDRPVLRIRFPGHEAQLGALARPLGPASLVIVIDDMGQRLETAEQLAALPFPVTFAVWPHARRAGEVERLAGERGLDVIVHLPMQPLRREGGKQPDAGPNALTESMSAAEMRAVLDAAFTRLPSAIGFNNHMGSRFTGSRNGCRLLCSQLRGQGLFVLDSMTQNHSVLCKEALQQGLVGAERNVFLDNERKVPAILAALDIAAEKARRHGVAIAIGHPYPETVQALRQWPLAAGREGVAVVSLRRLVWHLATRADGE